MGKSLTETAKAILMKEEGVPSVSPMDAGHPDRDAKTLTPLKASLRPGSGYADKRFSNPGATPESELSGAEDLGGQTPTSGAPTENLGAKAAGKKDTSKSSHSVVGQEPAKKLSEAEEMEEDIEISEELEDFINECIEQGLNEDEIAQAIEENFEIVDEAKKKEEEELEEKKKEEEELEEKKKEEEELEEARKKKEELEEARKAAMQEHVDALLAGETLSEDFKSKAQTIFESAVNARINEEIAILEEAYAKSLEEQVQNITAQLTEQVDDYLNYVVEQWVSDNEVAIESGLRSELTEDFISGLRNLFAEHYIDIPEEKVDVVQELGNKVEELEAKLNEEIDRNVALSKTINESKRFEVLVDACGDLTTTQAEKLKALAESVDFTSVEEYTQKINTLKESYFPTSVTSQATLDSADDADGKNMITENLQGPMAAYVRTLGKKLPR